MSGEIRACRRAGAGRVVGLALIVNAAGAAAADPVSDEVLVSLAVRGAIMGGSCVAAAIQDLRRDPGGRHY